MHSAQYKPWYKAFKTWDFPVPAPPCMQQVFCLSLVAATCMICVKNTYWLQFNYLTCFLYSSSHMLSAIISTLSSNVTAGNCNSGPMSPCCWNTGLSGSNYSHNLLEFVCQNSWLPSSYQAEGATSLGKWMFLILFDMIQQYFSTTEQFLN